MTISKVNLAILGILGRNISLDLDVQILGIKELDRESMFPREGVEEFWS